MKAVGIRELKNKLSRYLDEVKSGEVILVSDRGNIVAEIRTPTSPSEHLSPLERRLFPYVAQGSVSAPLPRDESVYDTASFALSAEKIDETLEEVRGET